MYCKYCGEKLEDHALFCRQCGRKITPIIDAEMQQNSGRKHDQRKPQHHKKRNKIGIAALVVAVVMIAAICAGGIIWYTYCTKQEQNPDSASGDSSMEMQELMGEVYRVAKSFEDENGLVPAESANSAIDAVYRAAKETPGVKSCEKDEYGVFIDVGNGLDYVYAPPVEEMDSGGTALNIVTMQPYYTENIMKSPGLDHDGLDTCAWDISESDARWSFLAQNDVNDEDVTLERILNLDDYKMILWHGHGGYTKKTGFYINTAIDATYEFLRQYPCVTSNNALIALSGELCLKPSFFRENYPENAFENAFIYLATCMSGKEREMADVFLEKGAAVVFVNSDSINRGYNLNMLHLIVESFCLGGRGTVAQRAMSDLSDGVSFNTAENWSIYDSLVLAQRVYGEKDFRGGHAAEVYYAGGSGVDRMTYSEWMDGFGDLEEPEELDVPLVVNGWVGSADYYTADEHGNDIQQTAVYYIPQFTMESREIESLNDDIMNTFFQAVEDSEREFSDSWSTPEYASITYEWAEYGDIVSVLVEAPYASIEWLEYYVYNASVTGKREATKEEVVSAAGMTIQEYQQLVKQALGSQFWNVAGPLLEGGDLPREVYAVYQTLLQDTISDENIAKAEPFFNADGQLCAAGTYGVNAGGGTCWTVVNLAEFELSPYYSEEIEVLENNNVVSTMYVIYDDVTAYLRSSPEERDDNILCTVPFNAEVGFIESKDSVYSRVKYNGMYGYIKSAYLGSAPGLQDPNPDVKKEEIGQLALAYYERHFGIRPARIEVSDNGDETYTIHLYDIVDNGNEAHTVTYAWYTVDENGIGTDDVFMIPVNLNT